MMQANDTENPKNQKCKFYSEFDGEIKCLIKMDLTFCGKNCAFATNNRLRSKVYKTRIDGRDVK